MINVSFNKEISLISWNYNAGRNSISLTSEVERDSLETKKKKKKYFLLPDHQLGKYLSLVFGFSEKTKKEIKSTFLLNL